MYLAIESLGPSDTVSARPLMPALLTLPFTLRSAVLQTPEEVCIPTRHPGLRMLGDCLHTLTSCKVLMVFKHFEDDLVWFYYTN